MKDYIPNFPLSSQKVLYRLSGKVVHGRGIGKLVGTPTADIQVSSQELPPIGVYISILHWHSHRYASVTNIGNRPTIDNDTHISVETLILDFHTDIYGSQVTIELLKFLRLPQKFKTLSDLREQVFCDCDQTRNFFQLLMEIHSDPLSQPLQFGSLCIDTQKRYATIQNNNINLTTKEYELLCILCSHPGWAYSKEQLYEAIWHEPANNFYHPVENLIYQLRKKLKSNGSKDIPQIITIVGYGYKFVI